MRGESGDLYALSGGKVFYKNYTDVLLPGCIRWSANPYSQLDRPKSLVIWGASRLGKTEWARSLGHHMYFNGLFDLGEWDHTAEYAVFDDWSDWSKFYFYKQFMGAQRQFTLTDKYRKKRTVRWGKPCIILANNRPQWDDEEWIEGNTIQCHLVRALF